MTTLTGSTMFSAAVRAVRATSVTEGTTPGDGVVTAAGLAPVLALVLLGLASAFQGALALGVPWGAMAYGGHPADGTLPVRYRVTSTLTLVVLGAAAWSVHAKVEPALWVFAAIFALNTMANLSGRHPVERWGMSALTLCLAACCATLALT